MHTAGTAIFFRQGFPLNACAQNIYDCLKNPAGFHRFATTSTSPLITFFGSRFTFGIKGATRAQNSSDTSHDLTAIFTSRVTECKYSIIFLDFIFYLGISSYSTSSISVTEASWSDSGEFSMKSSRRPVESSCGCG